MSSRVFLHQRWFRFIAIALTLWAADSRAAELDFGVLAPSRVFLQAGVAEEKTQAYVAGVIWDWSWEKPLSLATVTGYFEAAFGRWITDEDGLSGSAWATQVGLTPVLRFQRSDEANRWFAEIGIGANFILPLYRSEEKRFSTEFNFGDHFAVGRQFGRERRDELTLRVQHFSNGGIDHPNPGENFVQLRYSRRF